mgnify:CR=1 FL=1
MNDQEIGTLYGLMSRLKTDIEQSIHYFGGDNDTEQGKHFLNDARYTMQSLKSLVDKTKLK